MLYKERRRCNMSPPTILARFSISTYGYLSCVPGACWANRTCPSHISHILTQAYQYSSCRISCVAASWTLSEMFYHSLQMDTPNPFFLPPFGWKILICCFKLFVVLHFVAHPSTSHGILVSLWVALCMFSPALLMKPLSHFLHRKLYMSLWNFFTWLIKFECVQFASWTNCDIIS